METIDGIMFEATLITPFAPHAIKGRVRPSSPERITKSSPRAQAVSETLADLPPASFKAQMVECFSKSLSIVDVEISAYHAGYDIPAHNLPFSTEYKVELIGNKGSTEFNNSFNIHGSRYA